MRRAVRLATLAALVCAGTPLWPQAAGSQRITVNFRDTDIATVTESVATATGKTFIIDPRVRAQVNLISSTPMTAEEFYQAFLSVLQVNGFAAVPSGNVIKIVMQNDVRTVPGNDLPTVGFPGADEMVTQVVTAKNTNAAQLAQVLRPLIAQYGNIAPVPGTNTLIITDRAANVTRILRIINRVDQVGDANIEVIPLQNSSAADVVRTLTALTGAQAGAEAGGAAPKVVADERSNSILVSGDSAQRLRIATLIAHLDTPIENGGDTRVRYLRFADAEKIAPRLKEQLTGIAAATPGAAGAAGAAGGAAAAAAAGSTTDLGRARNQRADHYGAAQDHAVHQRHHRPARYPPRPGAGGGDHRGRQHQQFRRPRRQLGGLRKWLRPNHPGGWLHHSGGRGEQQSCQHRGPGPLDPESAAPGPSRWAQRSASAASSTAA